VVTPVASRTAVVPAPSADANSVLPLAPRDTKKRWRQLCAQPATIARDAELADTLEELADADSDIAAELLLSLGEADRRRVVAAILIDAAREPENAVRLAGRFCRTDPTVAADHGYALVATLARAGEFDAALRFVQRHDVTAGETENPSKWLGALFTRWAERQPQLAARAATALASEGLRAEALQSVATAWVKSDPAGAANFFAAGWAGRADDGALRSHTLVAVVRAWSSSDASAAMRYAQSSPMLLAGDRAALLAEFSTRRGP